MSDMKQKIEEDPDIAAIKAAIISTDEWEKQQPGYKGWRYYGDKLAMGIATIVIFGVLVWLYLLPLYSEHISGLIELFHSVKNFLASLL